MRVFLVSNGADLNAENEKGQTVLMIAVQKGRTFEVEVLLGMGPDLNVKNHEGKTALDLAKEKKYGVIVRMLEEAGE